MSNASDVMSNYLRVNLASQTLDVVADSEVIRSYDVSTAKNGPGERIGSECTPRGLHQIKARIGEGAKIYSVFLGRRLSGEIYTPDLARKYPNRDWILSRILWLSGLEPGRNRFGDVDTAWRYIYIHGSPDHCVNGIPESHGCVRMRNSDIIDLFERVNPGMRVWIA